MRPSSFLYPLLATLTAFSCVSTKSRYGLVTIEKTNDTLATKQAFAKIRTVSNDNFKAGSYAGKESPEIKYRLYSPKLTGNKSKKLPLVVVYHGSGSIGSDNTSQMGLLPKLFASPDVQENYPAYVLAPQFPTRSSDYVLDKERNVLTSAPRTCLNSALDLIDSLVRTLDIDNGRVYVVGYSMGASTVTNSIVARPNLFAAAISISGIPEFKEVQELSNIPVWLVHGIEDTENPIASDRQFYKERGSSHTLFWELKETSHDNVFTTQILGNTLAKWLFKQKRKY